MRLPTRKPGKYSNIVPDTFITADKLAQLQEKLAHLKQQHMPAANEVSRLAELGDFSENAEYQMAKARLRSILFTMSKLEHQIQNAQVLPVSTDHSFVSLGSTVTVLVDGVSKTFQILSSNETDPTRNIISHHSPLGSALLGHKLGEIVTIPVKGVDVAYTITQIA